MPFWAMVRQGHRCRQLSFAVDYHSLSPLSPRRENLAGWIDLFTAEANQYQLDTASM